MAPEAEHLVCLVRCLAVSFSSKPCGVDVVSLGCGALVATLADTFAPIEEAYPLTLLHKSSLGCC